MMKNVKVFYMDKCPHCKKLMGGLDEEQILYNSVDVNSEEGEKEFMKIYKFTKSENIPVIIIGNQVLVPEISFYTVEQALILIKNLYSETQ